MKRALLCLTCLLVIFSVGALSAEPATPVAKSPAKVSAPAAAVAPTVAGQPAAPAVAGQPAVQSPATGGPQTLAPVTSLEDAIFLSGPPCTYYECIQGCTDCPWGHTSYCISTAHCWCGCR